MDTPAKTLYTAFWPCGSLHMAIPTSHPQSEAVAASWRQQGYVVGEMTAGEMTRAGRECVVHIEGMTMQMRKKHADDKKAIYGGQS
jgi:hypothetical protein